MTCCFPAARSKRPLTNFLTTGAPAKVELAVLVDRGGRMLPMAADYTGLTLDSVGKDKVVVNLDADDRSADAVSIVAAKPKLVSS